MPAVGNRQDFIRSVIRNGALHPLLNQDSGALHALWQAHALAIRPAHAPAVAIGDPVDCLMLD